MNNPLLKPFNTPHQTAPFNEIETSHYEQAMEEGMKMGNEEIKNIIENSDEPTFENTILALENSGKVLDRVTTIFFNLLSAETNDEMDGIAERITPKLTEYSNNISLNEALFDRVKVVYSNKSNLNLSPEEEKLLEKTYDGFVRHGANLSAEDKEKFRKLSSDLSSLTLKFSQNHLKETNKYELHITDVKQLEGLPESALEAAAHTAKEKSKEGWVFTLHAPSYVPFMKYCSNRELRKTLYMAYNTQCTHNDEFDNNEIVKQLVNTRMQIAILLGFKNHADYVLRKRMAENSSNVYNLLNNLIEAYKPTAEKEIAEIEETAKKIEGNDFEIMPWNFSYYSEKLKNEKYKFDEESLRPYFKLENVISGVFGLATKLYGITFEENKSIPVYHPDVSLQNLRLFHFR
mgnify:FL=1